MKTTKLFRIGLVLAAIFTFSACEEEEIKVNANDKDTKVETVELD